MADAPSKNPTRDATDWPYTASFEELSASMSPEQKHRYTQWRAMQRQRDLRWTDEPEVLRQRGKDSRDLSGLFIKKDSDEGDLFGALELAETDSEAESDAPFGKQYGSDYASQTATMLRNPIRLSTSAQRLMSGSPSTYADGNSRYVGISERTFLKPETPLANAAKRRLEKTRGQRR